MEKITYQFCAIEDVSVFSSRAQISSKFAFNLPIIEPIEPTVRRRGRLLTLHLKTITTLTFTNTYAKQNSCAALRNEKEGQSIVYLIVFVRNSIHTLSRKKKITQTHSQTHSHTNLIASFLFPKIINKSKSSH